MSSSATSAAVAIEMPQMGVSVADGTIVAWLKQPGDAVAADETVCEVTTDKIDVEIPAPVAGTMGEQHVGEGEKVGVGTVLAELLPESSGARPGGPGSPAPAPAERDVTEAADEGGGGEIDRSRFYSPVVRRIANEYSVDLSRVPGRGIGGRVRKRDLVAFIDGGGNGSAGTRSRERTLHSDSPYRPEEPTRSSAPATSMTPPQAEPDLLGPSRSEPLAPMRQAIGRHMRASLDTSAHCTTIVEADFSAVQARRRELADRSVKPTQLAFVARATIDALERFPVLNASLEGERIVYHEDINLGIAVAIDDGLVVPVVRRAQRLSVEGLAAEIAELAERARAGKLTPDETHGGTFTITNPGRYGALLATPIINQPQVAILDLEAVVDRPMVVTDPSGAKSIGIRPMSYLCMSWDHRALDGVEAARFLGAVRERVEAEDQR